MKAVSSRQIVAAAACFAVFACVVGFGVTAGADAAGVSGLRHMTILRSEDGWSNDAALALSRKDFDAARSLSKKAIQASPLSQPSVRIAALVELATDEEAIAERMLRVGSKLGWRDTATQAQLMMFDAKKGDLASVLLRLDALQRRQGISAETQQFASLLLSEEEVATSFIDLLASNPPWRQEMFGATEFLDQAGAVRFAYALQQLKSRGVQVSAEEINPVMMRLVDVGSSDVLARVAPGLLGKSVGKTISDPDFEQLDSSLEQEAEKKSPFSWVLGKSKRATVNVIDTDENDSKVLYVQSQSRVPEAIVSQVLILAPGNYSLSYRTRSDRNADDTSLEWTLRCGPDALSKELVSSAGTGGWRMENLRFAVPKEGCPAQNLQLVSGRNLSGDMIEREYADLKISHK